MSSFDEVVGWRPYGGVAPCEQQVCWIPVPGQRAQLSDAASPTEGTKIFEIRNIQSELISRSFRVPELRRPDRGRDNPHLGQFPLSGHLVGGRRHERQGPFEREIA